MWCFFCVNCCLCHMQKLLCNNHCDVVYVYFFFPSIWEEKSFTCFDLETYYLGDTTSGLYLNKPVHHTKEQQIMAYTVYVLNDLNLQLCLYIIRDREKIHWKKYEFTPSLLLEITKYLDFVQYKLQNAKENLNSSLHHPPSSVVLHWLKNNEKECVQNSVYDLRCAPCIQMNNIAFTLENVEYLYRKYPKQYK